LTGRVLAFGLALALVVFGGAARAGPPFRTDDPETTDDGHLEAYLYASGSQAPGGFAGEGGLDLNWGAAKNLQINVVLPAGFAPGAVGSGEAEMAVKIRFLHQASGSAMPDVAIYPRVFLPTASAGFGSGSAQVFLPVWAQKDFGAWSVFGGGGYEINPGAGQRDFWAGGLTVARAIGKRWQAGVETYWQGATAGDTPASAVVNLGVTYKLTGHWSLLASAGPGLRNTAQTGTYDAYLSLEAQY
jgi:hypothetical protein